MNAVANVSFNASAQLQPSHRPDNLNEGLPFRWRSRCIQTETVRVESNFHEAIQTASSWAMFLWRERDRTHRLPEQAMTPLSQDGLHGVT